MQCYDQFLMSVNIFNCLFIFHSFCCRWLEIKVLEIGSLVASITLDIEHRVDNMH